MMNKQGDIQPEEEIDEEQTVSDGELEDLTRRVEELENKYRRALADYQNLEKRVAEERRDWLHVANRELLLRLLPILDTLMLAGKHSNDQSLQVSIQMFLDNLKDEGVKRIETVGKAFDPNLMEGMGTKEGEEGKVVEELRAGYVMHEKLLRPAQVIVGEKKEE